MDEKTLFIIVNILDNLKSEVQNVATMITHDKYNLDHIDNDINLLKKSISQETYNYFYRGGN